MDPRFEGASPAFGARGCVLLACAGGALTLGAMALSAASVPSFAGPRHYATGISPASVAIADVNGDGARDVAVANSANRAVGTVSVLLNRGDGSFRARRNYATAKTPESVVIGDLNGDRKPDLATANKVAGTVSVLLNRGDGSFRPRHDYRAAGRPRSIAIGDLNGDGKPDLATSNVKHTTRLSGRTSATRTRGTVSVFLARGDGSFAPRHDYRTAKNPVSLALGDLNGDGTPDLVTASVSPSRVSPRHRRGKISVLLNRGGGSFGARRDYGAGRSARSVTIGDLNGDGKLDVAAASEYTRGTVLVFLNRGGGRLRAGRRYPGGEPAYSVATGDLNGDRRPDLFVSTFRSVSVLVNRGNGRFRAGVDHPIDRIPFGDNFGVPVAVASGDLNGDGRPDVVTANDLEDNLSVLINRPGLCAVQYVVEQTLTDARRATTRARCRIGTIRRVYAEYPPKGRVISQKPDFGAVVPIGSKVDLRVSRGPKG
jgi:VCBS repeat protein/PASTA domain-containing protein/FG-GAP repeat protein